MSSIFPTYHTELFRQYCPIDCPGRGLSRDFADLCEAFRSPPQVPHPVVGQISPIHDVLAVSPEDLSRTAAHWLEAMHLEIRQPAFQPNSLQDFGRVRRLFMAFGLLNDRKGRQRYSFSARARVGETSRIAS
jgi:hypothetical protein